MQLQPDLPLQLYTGTGADGEKFARRLERLLRTAGTVTKRPTSGSRAWIAVGRSRLPEGAHPLRMNTYAASYETRSSSAVTLRFVVAGLAEAGRAVSPGVYRRHYDVTVFALRAVHIEVYGLFQDLPESTGSPVPGTPLFRRLEKTAVKALYAQGLDFGRVRLEVCHSGLEIVNLSAWPDLDCPEAGMAFADAVLETAEDWLEASLEASIEQPSIEQPSIEQPFIEKSVGNKKELLIGMDPEFLLFDQTAGKIVPASRFLGRDGRAGSDSVRIAGRRHFLLAELRPAPAGEPKAAVRHLMGAMREAAVQIGAAPLAWQAGGLPQPGLPLGGHLHFSGVQLTPPLLRALDRFLAIPVALLEDSRSASRRPRYGCLGDFRRQSHGGFEYRTLPSFLVSPVVTKGAVALALLVASEYKNGTLPEVPPEPAAALKAFYTGDREALRPNALQALEQAEALGSFSRYKDYIGPMFAAIREGRTWDESTDIRKAWKLTGAAYFPDKT